MTASRFFAIGVIFTAVSIGWVILGSTIEYRTASLTSSLSEEVNSLWGPSNLEQDAPQVIGGDSPNTPRGQIVSSEVTADFDHHNRYRGLLWFSTYTVNFDAKYKVAVDGGQQERFFVFRLPSNARTFERLSVTLDGAPGPSVISQGGDNNIIKVPLGKGQSHEIKITYQTRGRDRWLYSPAASGAGLLKDFSLVASTNFENIDYPKGSVSPIEPALVASGGARAGWKYDNILMSQPIGIEMPAQANAGPIAARMSYFAPVSLLFFFTVVFTIVVLKSIPLHPMHFLFIAGGFFAFHILLAYLVDLVNIHAAFWICATVSVVLVVSYMRLVAGAKFAVFYAGAAQMVYLIGFSYAFFWVGYTGLAVTIGAIATLFVLMQATGRVNWHEVFKRRNGSPDAPSNPPGRGASGIGGAASPLPPPIPGARP